MALIGNRSNHGHHGALQLACCTSENTHEVQAQAHRHRDRETHRHTDTETGPKTHTQANPGSFFLLDEHWWQAGRQDGAHITLIHPRTPHRITDLECRRRQPADGNECCTARSSGRHSTLRGEAARAHLCRGADDERELHAGGGADGDAGNARARHDVLRRMRHRLLRDEGGVADLQAAEAAQHEAERREALRLEDTGCGGEVQRALRDGREQPRVFPPCTADTLPLSITKRAAPQRRRRQLRHSTHMNHAVSCHAEQLRACRPQQITSSAQNACPLGYAPIRVRVRGTAALERICACTLKGGSGSAARCLGACVAGQLCDGAVFAWVHRPLVQVPAARLYLAVTQLCGDGWGRREGCGRDPCCGQAKGGPAGTAGPPPARTQTETTRELTRLARRCCGVRCDGLHGAHASCWARTTRRTPRHAVAVTMDAGVHDKGTQGEGGGAPGLPKVPYAISRAGEACRVERTVMRSGLPRCDKWRCAYAGGRPCRWGPAAGHLRSAPRSSPGASIWTNAISRMMCGVRVQEGTAGS